MRTYTIEGDSFAPRVLIDEAKGLVEISGNSILRNPQWYYSNLLKWLIAFNLGPKKTKTINIRLDRVNEISSKWIVLILNKLPRITNDNNLKINWFIVSKTEELKINGKIIRNLPGFRVNLVTIYGTTN